MLILSRIARNIVITVDSRFVLHALKELWIHWLVLEDRLSQGVLILIRLLAFALLNVVC